VVEAGAASAVTTDLLLPSDSDSTPIPTPVGTANSVHFAKSPIIINPSFDNSFAALAMNDEDSDNDDDGIVLDHVGCLILN
jgi:hypothetical protein